MGEIPSGALFSVKLWFAVAVLASAAVGASAGQVTSAQAANNPEKQASERRPLGLQTIPIEQKADILMARGRVRGRHRCIPAKQSEIRNRSEQHRHGIPPSFCTGGSA